MPENRNKAKPSAEAAHLYPLLKQSLPLSTGVTGGLDLSPTPPVRPIGYITNPSPAVCFE